jgi:hypothetical protein
VTRSSTSARTLQPLVHHRVHTDQRVGIGRRLVPPGERPSTDVAVRMGRERPRLRTASAAPSRFGGVAHAPHIMSVMCWGARLMVAETCALMTLQFPGRRRSQISRIVLPQSGRICARESHRLASLRCSIFRERLGASRLRSLTLTACAALTRPARSRVVCNYRSDGEISNGDSL